jgi:hypothetical protein
MMYAKGRRSKFGIANCSYRSLVDANNQSGKSGGEMRHSSRIRFFIEIALAVLTGTSFLLALVQQNWIEAVLGFSPDPHDGSVELVVASMLLAATTAIAVFARVEWRRRAGLANQGAR